jgi:hypothetical protein
VEVDAVDRDDVTELLSEPGRPDDVLVQGRRLWHASAPRRAPGEERGVELYRWSATTAKAMRPRRIAMNARIIGASISTFQELFPGVRLYCQSRPPGGKSL